MINILIVTGGSIDTAWFRDYIANKCYNYIIAVDKGLEYCHKINIMPNIIVGDNDTVNTSILDEYRKKVDKVIVYPPEKDYTDTHISVTTAFEYNPDTITIVGATGTRIDHVLANIGMLKLCIDNNVQAYIVDKNNLITMIDSNYKILRSNLYGKYISLLPYSEQVMGVTLEGFVYPLYDAILSIGKSIGISNELKEDIGHISVKSGYLIVVESMD